MTHARSPAARGLARRFRYASWVILVSWLVGVAAPNEARAQGAPRASSQADTLFQEGKTLLGQGKYAEACPKLAESQRLDPANGTLLALGLCHESEGRTASAWRELRRVAEASDRDGRADRAKLAREHVAAIEPSLSRLLISVPAALAGVAGLEVELDGEVVAQEEWNQRVPLDPGEHVVGAIATGKKRWTTRIVVGPKADLKVVALPELADAAGASRPPVLAPPAPAAPSPSPATPPPPPAVEEPPSTPGQGRRTAGYVVGILGLASIGVGTYFGITAIGKSSDAKAACPGAPSCTNQTALSLNDDAKTAAWVADIGLGVGVLGLVAGAYLVLSAPRGPAPPAATVRVVPRVGREGGALSLEGSW